MLIAISVLAHKLIVEQVPPRRKQVIPAFRLNLLM